MGHDSDRDVHRVRATRGGAERGRAGEPLRDRYVQQAAFRWICCPPAGRRGGARRPTVEWRTGQYLTIQWRRDNTRRLQRPAAGTAGAEHPGRRGRHVPQLEARAAPRRARRARRGAEGARRLLAAGGQEGQVASRQAALRRATVRGAAAPPRSAYTAGCGTVGGMSPVRPGGGGVVRGRVRPGQETGGEGCAQHM